MSTLEFHSYSFYSFPGATYLFFPALQAGPAEPAARSQAHFGLPARPARLVISSELTDTPTPNFTGTALGEALYVGLGTRAFLGLLKAVSDPERDFRKQPVSFDFDLDDEDSLARLSINGEPLNAGETRESVTAPKKIA